MNYKENDSGEGVPREESTHDTCLMFLLIHSLLYLCLPIYRYIYINEEDVGFVFPLKGVTTTKTETLPNDVPYSRSVTENLRHLLWCEDRLYPTLHSVCSICRELMYRRETQWDSAHINLG